MFKKKEKTEKAPKNKKVRTMKVGTHKKSVLLLWAVLLASTSFGVYKNFTAIDTHTVHEKEIIQLRLNDTNGIENFVKNFAKAYYSWDTSKEAIEARTTEISKYLTKELQDLNADTIRTDIPTSVTVTNVLVWNVEQSGTDDFTVAYEVDQQVKEGEQTQAVTENYTVTVHVDKDGTMVITQNPTLAPAVQKSKYEPKAQETDVSVSSDTVKDATAFLETFFKLYPTATEKELAYYVKDGVLAPVSGDYVFSELVNPVFTKDGDNLKVSVSYPTNVDYYKSLKKKWKVSMQAMMYRTRQLDIISANQFQYMMRTVSKNGWRTKEPGDVPGQLKDTIFQGAIDLLFDGGYLSVHELIREFNHYGIILSQSDLENLMGLREGTLYQESKIIPFMTVKNT